VASEFRVFVDASSADARARLVDEATRVGWRVVARRGDADAVLGSRERPVLAAPQAATRPVATPNDDDRDDDLRPREELTAREHDVLVLLADGAGNREIAERLGVTEHTVKFHLSAIFGKLSATTRTEAVRRALRWGWVDL
jgi:DNA-binding NarL/FixJ family response regulator